MSVVTCEHSVLRGGVGELSMRPDFECVFEGQRSQLQRHAQVQDCCLDVAEHVCQSAVATIHLNVAFMSVGTKSEKVYEQTVECQVRNDRRQTQTPPLLNVPAVHPQQTASLARGNIRVSRQRDEVPHIMCMNWSVADPLSGVQEECEVAQLRRHCLAVQAFSDLVVVRKIEHWAPHAGVSRRLSLSELDNNVEKESIAGASVFTHNNPREREKHA